MVSQNFQCSAAAKINLFLHVTGQRSDGYHRLQSLMACVSVCDELTLTLKPQKKGDITLTVTSDAELRWKKVARERNLVVRAARFFSHCHDDVLSSYRCHFTLHKKIPHGAGLGGGSSDAAATLRLLAHALRLPVPPHTEQLGADVPFCLHAMPAWVGEIGEKITPLTTPMPAYGVVLVYPHRPCSTRAIFGGTLQHSRPLVMPPAYDDLTAFLKEQNNDLHQAAIQHEPSIQQCLTLLKNQDHCLLARMSGSGSSCFALFATNDDAHHACHSIKQQQPQLWTAKTSIMTHAAPIICHP